MRDNLRFLAFILFVLQLYLLSVGHAWTIAVRNGLTRNVAQGRPTLVRQSSRVVALAAGSTLPDNFNPFQQVSSLRISTRQMRMKAITQELLYAVQANNNDQNNQFDLVLQEHKDFLLEPLDDFENVIWDDNTDNAMIYSADMTRAERYQAYRVSMEERIDAAKHPSVRQVLILLRDFVLSHE